MSGWRKSESLASAESSVPLSSSGGLERAEGGSGEQLSTQAGESQRCARTRQFQKSERAPRSPRQRSCLVESRQRPTLCQPAQTIDAVMVE